MSSPPREPAGAPAIYYDLTELFHVSGSRFKFYGIARTVMEVGYELARAHPHVRFVVHSPAHARFHEVTPQLGGDSPTGVIDPGLPTAARPVKLRSYHADRGALFKRLHSLLAMGARAVNRRRWKAVDEGAARAVDLDGQILLTLSRPKLIANFLHDLGGRGETPVLVPLLYDLIPLRETADGAMPSFATKFLNDNRYVIEHAAHVLTISHATTHDIEHFADRGLLPRPRRLDTVQLCHEVRLAEGAANHADDAAGYADDAAGQADDAAGHADGAANHADPPSPVSGDFLLCVGITTGRKNLEGVLRGMLRLAHDGRPVPALVLAGAKRKRTAKLLAEPEFDAIRDKVVFRENPDQAALVDLYRRARAVVVASFIEGWGLPLGEALWLGTPVLSARIAALEEVGGDLPIYFDPASIDEIAASIDRIMDPDVAAERRERIRAARPRLRTWADVANDLYGHVRQLAATGGR